MLTYGAKTPRKQLKLSNAASEMNVEELIQ